jgi:STE24 endopeptidase
MSTAPPPTAETEPARRVGDLAPWWAAVVALVVIGVTAQVWRPLAPAVGPVPDASRWFDAAHLARVDAYWRPIYAASLVSLVVRIAIPLLVALTGPGRRAVAALVGRVGEQRPAQAAAAVAVAILVVSDVVLAPLSFWAAYIHEDAFGFRVQGVAGWARDWMVGRAPTWLGVALLVLLGYALVSRLPRAWPLVAGLAGASLTGALVFASPFVLEPLRFSTTPLVGGELREEVTALIDDSGLQADTVLVADASRRTVRHNAYVSGLGRSRRVVLYDTLVADRPTDEVLMVVAHELGHERNHDLLRGTLMGAGAAALVAMAIGALVRRRVAAGQQRGQTDPHGIAAIVALVVVLNAVSLPVQSALSRRAENAADHAALVLTDDPATFITMNTELSRTNLSDPQPPTWARLLWSSHPSTVQRLARGESWAALRAQP